EPVPLADVGTPLLGRMRSSGPPDHAQEHVGVGCAHPWDERVPSPGRDATLLAVVPIPGTGTSLAVVGYVIATSAGPQPEPPRPAGEPRRTRGAGLRLDHAQRRVWAEGREIQLTFQEFELLAFLSAH